MFTRRKSYIHQHNEEGPPEGSDSCYGVRSLSNSVWSEEVPESADGEAEFSPTVGIPIQREESKSEGPTEDVLGRSYGSNETMTPLTGHSTLQPPIHLEEPMEEFNRRLSLAALPPHDDETEESIPSSPASFTFSCIASLSSLSRTSSPVSGIPYRDRLGEELDLVVPRLSLPSSSLHMSLPKFDGAIGETIKIGIIGSSEHVGEVLRGLQAEGVDLVETMGGIGVLRGDIVTMVIYTSSNVESQRVNDGYAALDELLNPALPRAKEEDVKKLALAYAGKSDWIHTVLVIDNDPSVNILAEIVPVVTTLTIDGPVLNLYQESRAPTPSPPKLGDDPTPMPSVSRAESYFALPTLTNLAVLQQAIESSSRIAEASITQYMSWRTADHTPLHSSFSATSPSSSSFGTQPMPTVARASGGAQWESEVSRREANNRRLRHRRRPSVRDEYYLEKKRRKSCGPNLFPKGNGKPVISGSIGEMMYGMWGYVKGVSGWKWGLAAAAVLFVGLGLDFLKTK